MGYSPCVQSRATTPTRPLKKQQLVTTLAAKPLVWTQEKAHSEHRFPAPSSKGKYVVNQCLEFEEKAAQLVGMGCAALAVALALPR